MLFNTVLGGTLWHSLRGSPWFSWWLGEWRLTIPSFRNSITKAPQGEVIYPRKQSPHSNLSVRSLDYIFLRYQLPEKEVSKPVALLPKCFQNFTFSTSTLTPKKALGFARGRKKKQLLYASISSTHRGNFLLTPMLGVGTIKPRRISSHIWRSISRCLQFQPSLILLFQGFLNLSTPWQFKFWHGEETSHPFP